MVSTFNARTGAWLITSDHIADDSAKHPSNANAVGMLGPGKSTFWDSHPVSVDSVANHPDAVDFKLYDDDGELYYEGVMILGDGDENDCFGPLDDFGRPNAGAVRLDYLENGQWKTM